MKILKGSEGWWVFGSETIALLPTTAVNEQGIIADHVMLDLENGGFFQSSDGDDATYYLTVLTSTSCNCGCNYCFQNTGAASHGVQNPPRLKSLRLDVDTTAKILRFTQQQMRFASKTGLHILLFGGEPLLNPEGCLDLLKRARPLGLVGAIMVSNGYLLGDELANELAHYGLKRVKVTFDGARRAHDTIRTTRSGRPTYEQILTNLQRCTDKTVIDWDIRINISKQNIDSIDELTTDLIERLDGRRCAVDFAPVYDIGNGYSVGLDLQDESFSNSDLISLLTSCSVKLLEHGFTLAPPPSSKGCVYCAEARGLNGAVVNADGKLYSCWETAGRVGWDVGDVDTGYLPDELLRNRWVSCGFDQTNFSSEDLEELFDRVAVNVLEWQLAAGRL
ncbi:hypothetical protein GCM10009785_07760 [Brooklawnia cerclae]|uniref:Radical SAM core domain-containing protein n=1 Tax=Brooklawnia cerclae TaxID=349934 RepID=A0ABX0SIX4_9ACTN|nr:radical SAM protein [Brooklawnia cerclae]NIH58355.1 uncharacterized protein [Brooklawnia cerclae]